MASKKHLSADSIITEEVMNPSKSFRSLSGIPVAEHLASHAKSHRDTKPSKVNPSQTNDSDLVFGCIPKQLFADPSLYVATVRTGIPGEWLDQVVTQSGIGEHILKALGMTDKRLKAAVLLDALDTSTSETVLEIARILSICRSVWESQALAETWLKSDVPALCGESPVELLDTHEGRRWVTEVLRKAEEGEFS